MKNAPHNVASTDRAAQRACRIIVALLKPTIKTRPKDAVCVMLQARVLDSIYATALKGIK